MYVGHVRDACALYNTSIALVLAPEESLTERQLRDIRDKVIIHINSNEPYRHCTFFPATLC